MSGKVKAGDTVWVPVKIYGVYELTGVPYWPNSDGGVEELRKPYLLDSPHLRRLAKDRDAVVIALDRWMIRDILHCLNFRQAVNDEESDGGPSVRITAIGRAIREQIGGEE